MKPVLNLAKVPLHVIGQFESTVFPVTGMMVGDVRSLLKGKEPKHDKTYIQEGMSGIGYMGGLGILGDLITASKGSYLQLAEFGMGPVLTEVNQHAKAVAEVLHRGNVKPLAKELLRDLPLVGQNVLQTRTAIEKATGLYSRRGRKPKPKPIPTKPFNEDSIERKKRRRPRRRNES